MRRYAKNLNPPIKLDQLQQMFGAVDSELLRHGCDNTLLFTKLWLARRGHDVSTVVAWLQRHGGYCDCEVLLNVEHKVNGGADA